MDKFQGLDELLLAEFTDKDEQLFLNNFRQYLQYDQDNDFVIDLDDVYEWIGFTQKKRAKRLLVKELDKDIQYKISSTTSTENKEVIMMTPNGFKNLCMLSDTEKAKSIRKYYMKLGNILFNAISTH